ncbi:hypothetical protein SAMN05660976_03567 [Nonomuraea pusilla]|uniref:Uncharacterized protein n=1 Tax=Nonomuraea pusilla TaxID=46177 RepID=A0A1H7TN41_9ACTN|nr:hypothetical protein SAMN05660976_03567 [Nonomuraea pusilla]
MGLDAVGAEGDGGLVRQEGVRGPVRAGAPVADDDGGVAAAVGGGGRGLGHHGGDRPGGQDGQYARE